MANPSRLDKIQITGNANSATATKVNVQEANGEVNTQTINTGFNKNFGLNSGDVVGANTLLNQYSTTPVDWTATAFNSGQVVFYGGKQWIAKIATVAGDVPAVSSKWEEITFDALANKTVIVDAIPTDGSNNAVSSNGVFDALATKAPISSVHNPVTIGTANGLSLATQKLSLVLATSSTTGALSGTDWNTFNNKENAFSKNTAFNKNFGITAGTVVEGGTLGANAYNSTAYLPLTGGSLSGYLSLNDRIPLVLGDESTSRLRFITSSGVNYIQSGTGSGYGTRADLVITGNYGGNETVRFKADGTTIFSGTVTASPATTANQVVVKSQLDAAARPYKVYTALLTQTGTNAPTATVLENTLGGTVVWSRGATGVYIGTLTNTFLSGKTICFATKEGQITSTLGALIYLGRNTNDNVIIRVQSTALGFADSLLVGDSIEIRVYP